MTACPHGPLLVRGDVEILLGSGAPAARRRRTVALCRCGASAIKPFCDGSHKAVGFRTDDEPLDDRPLDDGPDGDVDGGRRHAG